MLNRILEILRARGIAAFAIAGVTVLALAYLISSQNMLVVNDGASTTIHTTYMSNVWDAMRAAGVEMNDGDRVTAATDGGGNLSLVSIHRGGDIILEGGKSSGIVPLAAPPISPDPDTQQTGENPADPDVSPTNAQADDDPLNKLLNKRKKLKPDPVEPPAAPAVVADAPDAEAQPGADQPEANTITLADGTVLKYKKKLDVQATAYTTEGYKQKRNASGKIARTGTIAVDPKVIPLGSKVYITSRDGKSWIYGTAVCEDTGGAIKGNIIDLFFDTRKECFSFGRQKATIYVLE